jgi:uncharacterized membrane protein
MQGGRRTHHKQNGGVMKTRQVVLSAIVAALYVVLTVGLLPISYGQIQFRVSEILKVFVLFDPYLAIGIGIGTFFANLASPNVSPWELIWMPLTDMAGGLIAWAIFKYLLRNRLPALPMILYAITTGAAVGWMLSIMGLGEFWYNTLFVGISELIILVAGVPIIFGISKMLNMRGIYLQSDAHRD